MSLRAGYLQRWTPEQDDLTIASWSKLADSDLMENCSQATIYPEAYRANVIAPSGIYKILA